MLKCKSDFSSLLRYLVPSLIIGIGVCHALVSYFYTYTGDDLMYRLSWEQFYKDITGYPLFAFRHWRGSNGRMANILNPLWLSGIHQWLFAVLSGFMTWKFFRGMIDAARFPDKSVVGQVVMIAIVVFCFTWWDAIMTVYVLPLNYIWSVAFVMFFTELLCNFRTTERLAAWKLVLICIFSAICGGMHEALTAPLLCGIAAYLYIVRNEFRLNRLQWIMLWSFAAGVLFVVSSPGIWSRFGHVSSDGVSGGIVVLTSAYLTLLMIVWLAVGMAIKPMRENMLRLARTPWIVFVVASIVSLAFCAVSGIIGRTGWFSQLFAVIAVFYYYNAVGLRIRRSFAAVVTSVVLMALVVHYAELLRQQHVMGNELKTALDKYEQSPDGVIYMDYTRDSQQRPWALRKARGIPDPSATEMYYINSITKYYGEGRQFIVLPKTLERVDAREISGIMNLGNEYYVTDRALASGWDTLRADASDVALYFPQWGRRDGYAVVPFYKDSRRLYLLSPREIDPDSPEFYAKIIGR